MRQLRLPPSGSNAPLPGRSGEEHAALKRPLAVSQQRLYSLFPVRQLQANDVGSDNGDIVVLF